MSSLTSKVKSLLEESDISYCMRSGVSSYTMEPGVQFIIDTPDNDSGAIIESCGDKEHVMLLIRTTPEKAVEFVSNRF